MDDFPSPDLPVQFRPVFMVKRPKEQVFYILNIKNEKARHMAGLFGLFWFCGVIGYAIDTGHHSPPFHF
ncbi:unknow (plasmid) [Vibrio parahaemolyticus]|nr:unknow [Vibrio parahaemolyticus]